MLQLPGTQNLGGLFFMAKLVALSLLLSPFLPANYSIAQSIQAEINQIDQVAIFGQNLFSGTGLTFGVYGSTLSSNGVGVYGKSEGQQSVGVLASGNNGLIAFGNKIAIIADVDSVGIYSDASGTAGIGVQGKGRLAGVVGFSNFSDAVGVSGQCAGGIGVEGYSETGFDFFASGPGINYGSGSSRRWKSNIRLIDNPLKKIAALRGVYYTWDTRHGGHSDIGFIAEEVGEVLPEIVAYEENGVDAKGMDYTKITPLLVEAFNALHREHDLLKADYEISLQQLNHRIKSLEEIIEKLSVLR